MHFSLLLFTSDPLLECDRVRLLVHLTTNFSCVFARHSMTLNNVKTKKDFVLAVSHLYTLKSVHNH